MAELYDTADDDKVIRAEALAAAARVYEGTGAEGAIRVTTLAALFVKFIEKGQLR